MNISVNVNIPGLEELARSIHVLASAMAFQDKKHAAGQTQVTPATVVAEMDNTIQTNAPVAALPAYQQPVQAQPVAPMPQQVAQPAVPVQQPMQAPVQQPAPVPTTPQTYSMEQLAVAATQLVDAGRRNELVGLLGQFGVQALTALPKEQYGAFATALRSMGAKI